MQEETLKVQEKRHTLRAQYKKKLTILITFVHPEPTAEGLTRSQYNPQPTFRSDMTNR